MTNIASFPRNQLHPGAAAAIDKAGTALLDAREVGTVEPVGEPAFKSRRIPKDTITTEDLAGEPMLGWSTPSGEWVGRYFVSDGKMVALREEGYRQLRRLVEKVIRAKPFSRGFSENFIEVEIFTWWRATLRAQTGATLSGHLLDAAQAAYGSHTVMVPLANIEIERAFNLGNVLVTPFNPALFTTFETETSTKFPEYAEIIAAEANHLRDELGHLTAVQVEIEGERDYAKDRAHRIATEMADIFRVMSPPAATRNIRFACFPLGLEHEPKSTILELKDGKISHLTDGFHGNPSFRWKLPFAELDRHMTKSAFRNCSVFFDDVPLTTFQQRMKTAFSAYGESVAAIDLRNRLLYAMSAAEHLLLRDDNEPIQSSVGERMAFLIAKEPDARRAVVANFKKAYGLRSRQVHHLANLDDEDALDTFFANMWAMMVTSLQNLPRYKEHSQFLDAIDRMKFS